MSCGRWSVVRECVCEGMKGMLCEGYDSCERELWVGECVSGRTSTLERVRRETLLKVVTFGGRYESVGIAQIPHACRSEEIHNGRGRGREHEASLIGRKTPETETLRADFNSLPSET